MHYEKVSVSVRLCVWGGHMKTTKRIFQRICISVITLCMVCFIVGCGESQNGEINTNDSESVSSDQLTQESEIDTSGSKTAASIQGEATNEIVDDYIEKLEDGRMKHTFHLFDDSKMLSVVVPSNWERGTDDIFSETFETEYVTKDSKRMEFRKLQGTTIEQWTEGHADDEGPLNGVTDNGCEYIGYYRDSQIEKDVHWRVYYFLVVSKDDSLYSISTYQNLDADSEKYLDTVIVPAIESVIIE